MHSKGWARDEDDARLQHFVFDDGRQERTGCSLLNTTLNPLVREVRTPKPVRGIGLCGACRLASVVLNLGVRT